MEKVPQSAEELRELIKETRELVKKSLSPEKERYMSALSLCYRDADHEESQHSIMCIIGSIRILIEPHENRTS